MHKLHKGDELLLAYLDGKPYHELQDYFLKKEDLDYITWLMSVTIFCYEIGTWVGDDEYFKGCLINE